MAEPASKVSAVGWIAPASLCALFLTLLAWSWRKWTDVHIDFGNELYIAWQLSEGQALYADIAHRNGPLSHYLNAGLFAAFGVSIRTLVLANLAVLAAICAMVWRVFAGACERFTATAAVATLLVGFAFGQYSGIANFNYVTPYHHYQTHGLALSLAMLLAFDRAARSGGRLALMAAGACLGAVFLTKAELFVPALALAAAAFTARAFGIWGEPGRATRDLAACALGAAMPIAGFAIGLAAQMPLDTALTGLAGNWVHLGGTFSDAFYRTGAGLDDIAGNASRAGVALLAIAGFAALAAAHDRLGQTIGHPRFFAVTGAALLLAGLVIFSAWIPWLHLARALPFTSLVAALWLGLRVLPRADAAERERVFPLFLWSVYAAALLAKLGLAARFHQYGFVLAMPATLLLVAAGTHALPAALRARHENGLSARALSTAMLIGGLGFLLALSQRHYAPKQLVIGTGADAIVAKLPSATSRPRWLAETLADLEARMGPEDTLLVLPEGISLNYWLRRRNPTRFNLFLPTEIQAFGEDAMLADLAAHPPDFVVLAHRPSAEFGVGPFGRDPRNGRRLRAWVDAHYAAVQRFGAEPFLDHRFGTIVLERSLR